MKINKALSILLSSFLFFFFVRAGNCGGVFGGFISWVGERAGIKEVRELGISLDNVHGDFKKVLPIYACWEESTAKMVREVFAKGCAQGFEIISKPVIYQCSNWDGRLQDQEKIIDAKNLLINKRIIEGQEFNGVEIRWCPFIESAGMAPDREVIYIDTDYKAIHVKELSALLAHEMIHISQYRKMGTDNFKCTYSKQFVECGGNQDRCMALEREAYDYEAFVRRDLGILPIEMAWNATSGEIGHLVGKRENDEWVVYANESKPGHFSYGPYFTKFVEYGSGRYTAFWDLAIDNNSFDNLCVATIDVYDATNKKIIAQKSVLRTAWESTFTHQRFELPFKVKPDSLEHQFEFRIYWHGNAHIRLSQLGFNHL